MNARALLVGDALRRGYRVRTGDSSSAEIAFSDGTWGVLGERSLLVIAGEDAGPGHEKADDTILRQGRLEVHIDFHPHGDGDIHIRTPGFVSRCFHHDRKIAEILRQENRPALRRSCLSVGNASIPKKFDYRGNGQRIAGAVGDTRRGDVELVLPQCRRRVGDLNFLVVATELNRLRRDRLAVWADQRD